MENKMERTNLHDQRGWVSLYQATRPDITSSFFSSGWESLLPATTQYRNTHLDTDPNSRWVYYVNIADLVKKTSCLLKTLTAFFSIAFQLRVQTDQESIKDIWTSSRSLKTNAPTR